MVPGSFNPLVSLIIKDLGFKASYLSGAALSASRGKTDTGILTLTDFTNEISD